MSKPPRRIQPGRRVSGKLIAKWEALAEQPPGLGDRLAARLARWGVTPARYVRWKCRCGFAPLCGCDKRREQLNLFGRWFGCRLAAAWRRLAALASRLRRLR